MHRLTRLAVVICALAAGHAVVSAAHPAAERSCGRIRDVGARSGNLGQRCAVACLAVDVLGGAPGIFSARWSGGGGDRANLELLLAQLGDVRDEHRAAAFVCAAAIVLPDGRSAAELGRFPGTVAREARGTGGFGYDPIFVPSDQPLGNERTLAEYDADEKNQVSHRALAFRALVPHLKEHLRP